MTCISDWNALSYFLFLQGVDWYCWSKYWPCLYLIVALHRMKVTNYLNRFECKYWEGCFSRKVTIFSNRTLMNIILDLPPHQDEIKPSPYTGPLYYVLPLIIIVISSYLIQQMSVQDRIKMESTGNCYAMQAIGDPDSVFLLPSLPIFCFTSHLSHHSEKGRLREKLELIVIRYQIAT